MSTQLESGLDRMLSNYVVSENKFLKWWTDMHNILRTS